MKAAQAAADQNKIKLLLLPRAVGLISKGVPPFPKSGACGKKFPFLHEVQNLKAPLIKFPAKGRPNQMIISPVEQLAKLGI